MTQYINGMIWLDPKYEIPENPKEAILYIKELRKLPIDRAIEQMEDSEFYFKMRDLETPN